MKYRSLGSTDLLVSEVSLGTMNFGTQVVETDAKRILSEAVELGINTIDTAEMYPVPFSNRTVGVAESIIGRWAKQCNQRERVVLCTKLMGPGFDDRLLSRSRKFTRNRILRGVESALGRLRTDYLDILLLHWPERRTTRLGSPGQTNREPLGEETIFSAIEGLEAVLSSGKVRYVGVSNETAWGIMKYLSCFSACARCRFSVLQNPYNLLNRIVDVSLAEVVLHERLGLMTYSPYAHGTLTGKYLHGAASSESRLCALPSHFKRYSTERSRALIDEYASIISRYGVPMTAGALDFVLSRRFVSTSIIGVSSLSQLKDNLGYLEVLVPNEMRLELAAVSDRELVLA